MKKILTFIGCAAMVALLATGCQNDIVEEQTPDTPDTPDTPVVEEPQELVLTAVLPQTRTILNADYSVSWYESDQIAVFNAPTGTTEYSDNLKFDIVDTTTGTFAAAEGVEVPYEEGVNYDWYVCCPHRVLNGAPELKTPAGASGDDGYFPIGAITQTGYNSTSHISSFDVMVGKATNTRTPNVTLKHLAVLHKFTVTNDSNIPTTITKITLDGGDNKLFGTFWLDLTADEPALDIANANNTYASRALTVKDGTALAVGESADFYMLTAPFTLNTGETFAITITTTAGEQTIEKTATSDIEFKAGTYNTAALVYDYEVPLQIATDHLYSETFNGTFANSEKVDESNTSFTPSRWDTYDKGGMLVYDGIVTNVNYGYDDDLSTLTRQVAGALKGMDDLHVRFKTGGVLTVSGIKLHGKTALTWSYAHTYKSSSIKTEYSVDGGTTWTVIGTSTQPADNAETPYSYNFTVPEGSEIINLRITATASTPRIDFLKLGWQ